MSSLLNCFQDDAYYAGQEAERLRGKAERLRQLLCEAMDSRAPDYAEAAYPGWADRVRAALNDA
jgi:hypothetical protein